MTDRAMKILASFSSAEDAAAEAAAIDARVKHNELPWHQRLITPPPPGWPGGRIARVIARVKHTPERTMTMGLAEDRAYLQAANEHLGEALAEGMATAMSLATATQNVTAAAADFDNQDLMEATGLIADAAVKQEEITGQIAQAQQKLEAYIASMS